MLARLLALLERDPQRVALAGAALVALGIVTTLRTLADAAGQWSDALPVGDRAVLGLYHARPAHAVPFLFGAALVVLSLRLRRSEPGWGAGMAAGVAWAYVGLGVAGALVAVYCAATGTFGEGAALVELSTRERTFGFAEQLVGSLAVALAALAGARALLGTPEPEPVRGLEDEDDEEPAGEVGGLTPLDALAVPFGDAGGGNGRVPGAAIPLPGSGSVPAADLPAPAAASEEPAELEVEPEPEVLTTTERYRRLYERRLRFSPRAAEARALMARLRDDPDDADTQRALDRLAEPRRTVD
jgi:hypothetical protein